MIATSKRRSGSSRVVHAERVGECLVGWVLERGRTGTESEDQHRELGLDEPAVLEQRPPGITLAVVEAEWHVEAAHQVAKLEPAS